MNSSFRNLAIWVVIILLLVALFNLFQGGARTGGRGEEISYSDFLAGVESGNISEVTIQKQRIWGSYRDKGSKFLTVAPPEDPGLVTRLEKKGVKINAKLPEDDVPSILGLLANWFPMLLLIGVWIFFMRQMQSGGGRAMGFGKSKAKLLTERQGRVTFEDVAGVDEAKSDLQEIVEFLRDPQKFQRLGGRIPRGCLLVGPPGTGKTLIARAVAGEANVPFFTISGSDFVEMFVGVGASRVRDMFEQAKKNAPCIIFIRPDVLDPALLRPGRFDRQIVVPNPDVGGREKILKVHMRKVPLAPDVDAKVIARGTPGFSGADLANLVNEAALLAARRNKRLVTQAEFEDSKDKVMMGAERRSMIMTEEEKRLTAYHEAGHAIVGMHVPQHDPLHKVTIIPRGRALGVTVNLPERDRLSYTRQYCVSRLASVFGGREAEILIFGPDNVTNGATGDIQQATRLSRAMVMEWGMSEKLGRVRYHGNEQEVFLGHSVTQTVNMSEETAKLIDDEIRSLVEAGEQTARRILTEHVGDLHKLAKALLEHETLSADEVDKVLRGEPIVRNNDYEDTKGPAGPAVPAAGKSRPPRPEPGRGGLEPYPQT
jgi:cell division protease FtsH